MQNIWKKKKIKIWPTIAAVSAWGKLTLLLQENIIFLCQTRSITCVFFRFTFFFFFVFMHFFSSSFYYYFIIFSLIFFLIFRISFLQNRLLFYCQIIYPQIAPFYLWTLQSAKKYFNAFSIPHPPTIYLQEKSKIIFGKRYLLLLACVVVVAAPVVVVKGVVALASFV